MTHTIFYLSFLFSLVGVLLGVAFFTLMERKIMGLMHYRKGPNKIIIMGMLQPISDAVKLLAKETIKSQSMKMFMFTFGPFLGMFLMLLCWMAYESVHPVMSNNMKIFYVLALMSLSAFVFMFTSWGSNSKYALIGGYRSISQVISYEVCLVIFLLILFYTNKSYMVSKITTLQENLWMMFFSMPVFLMWMMLCMAEANRTPFDLAEGESEIVSGFNIEYGSGLFAMIFITEYGMILFLSFLTSIMFIGGGFIIMKTMMVAFLFIWIRCSFPRIRYDKLMQLCWKISLIYGLSAISLSLAMIF